MSELDSYFTILNGKTFYQFLEVGQRATDKEIISAVRQAYKKYHPDRGPASEKGWRTEMSQLIGYINKTLMDPKTRQIYDQYGFVGLKRHTHRDSQQKSLAELISIFTLYCKDLKFYCANADPRYLLIFEQLHQAFRDECKKSKQHFSNSNQIDYFNDVINRCGPIVLTARGLFQRQQAEKINSRQRQFIFVFNSSASQQQSTSSGKRAKNKKV